MDEPWYLRQPERFENDKSIVASVQPTLQFVIDEVQRQASFQGDLVVQFGEGLRDRFRVRIHFPSGYPDEEPVAYDVKCRFPMCGKRHFTKVGACCLWLPPKSRWKGHDPNALLNFLRELALFFIQQLAFDEL